MPPSAVVPQPAGSGRFAGTGQARAAIRSRKSLARFVVSGLVRRGRPGAGRPAGRLFRGEASVIEKTIPRHARTFDGPGWGPGPGEGRFPGMENPGPELRLAQEQGRGDPLAGPVVITERAVLGDRLRRPTAWCEMPACISRHDDPAAAGEADIRARALAAGWQHDAVGRLVCAYCQQHNPGLWAAYPLTRQHRPPAGASRQHPAHAQTGRIGTVWTTLFAWHRHLRDDLARRPRWPQVLAALAGGGNGRNTPPLAHAADRGGAGRSGPSSRATGNGHLTDRFAGRGRRTTSSRPAGPDRHSSIPV